MNTLEDEFAALVTAHKEEITEKLREASMALNEAVQLSEKYGIPFMSHISFLSQGYTPRSFEAKFGELEEDVVCHLTDCYPGGEYGGDGWEHSAVC